jgi:hypothetical protein
MVITLVNNDQKPNPKAVLSIALVTDGYKMPLLIFVSRINRIA